MSSIEFVFDVASPNAYLAYHALKGVETRTGAELKLTPCLLGGIFKETGNQAPMLAFANIRNKLDYDMLEIDRFIKAHGLTRFRFNPHFPVNTLAVMRGAAALQLDAPDRVRAYCETGLKAMWEDERDLGDPAVIAEVLSTAGFDADALFARTQEPDVKQRLIANTKDAVERGAFGIPTFFVGSEMFFGKERLAQVEAEHKRQSA
ncbi:MAG: 2-hydroxychromene-2-carboxylate isomerase [Pseudomonadota bacterium]